MRLAFRFRSRVVVVGKDPHLRAGQGQKHRVRRRRRRGDRLGVRSELGRAVGVGEREEGHAVVAHERGAKAAGRGVTARAETARRAGGHEGDRSPARDAERGGESCARAIGGAVAVAPDIVGVRGWAMRR